MTVDLPAILRLGTESVLLEMPCTSEPSTLYWMNAAALYAEIRKPDPYNNQEVIWPESLGVRAQARLSSVVAVGTFWRSSERSVSAPTIIALPDAHPTRERRIRWSDGRLRTAIFAALGVASVPLACDPAIVPLLQRIEADFAAGRLPATVQPAKRALRAARRRWSPFEITVDSALLPPDTTPAAQADRRARREQFRERLSERFTGVRVRFTGEGGECVRVTHFVDGPWFSRLLRVRHWRGLRLLTAADRLSRELGLL